MKPGVRGRDVHQACQQVIDEERELRPGMAFHLPPALREYDVVGVGVSETVLVTETGAEVITNFPRDLQVR